MSSASIPPGFAPILMAEVELSQPLPALQAGAGELGVPYGSAQCLVRLHGTPLGFTLVELAEGELEPQALASAIWEQVGTQVASHLRDDGLPVPDGLGPEGLPETEAPRCRERLQAFLAAAPSISVVIPTKDRPAGVAATVRGIAACDYPRDRCELIVVDNGSGEDARVAPEMLQVPEGMTLKLVSEAVPGGSNARNRGVAEASGEVVVCADDDVEADREWLARMVAPFSDPRVGGVAGLTVPSELETPAQVWFEGFGGFMRGFERRDYDFADPPPDRPLFPFTVGDFGSGQNMAFRRAALEQVGDFDPVLGTATPTLAGEDLELMLRVLLAGSRVVYEPAAIVRHEHQRELEQFRRRVWGYGVGLTACLSKAVAENPRLLLPLLVRKLFGGLRYALSPASGKNENKQVDYPPELTRLELRGLAYGPLAYLRSRRKLGGRRGGATSPPTDASGAGDGSGGPLRVLIVSDSHPPLIGGANRSVELLSRHLVERGHTVAVATAWQEGLPAVEDFGGVSVNRIRDLPSRARWISEDPYKHNPPPFPDPEAIRELRRLVREFEPDLVHAYGWLAHSAAAALRDGEAPLLLSARDYGNFCAVRTLIRKGVEVCDGPAPAKCTDCATHFYGLPKGPIAAASVLASGALLRRRVDAIHSVSNYVEGQMNRHLRVPGAIERVIPNFHEDTSDHPIDEAVMAQLPGEPFILFVGAFRRIKGIEELLEAYARLEGPPPLVLAGTMATDTPQPFPPPGVTAIEDVPHATVMAIWERAMFGVLPTKAPEALGNVVHEAMSKGRAMIGTRPGGQEDMIEDGQTGLLVPGGDSEALAEAMRTLIGDPELRRRMGERGRERSLEFTPEAVMPQLEALYRETVRRFGEQRV
jgi:glycosyltransferase involved in cell wall biosynthesis/GT2 family glycosyltransferase